MKGENVHGGAMEFQVVSPSVAHELYVQLFNAAQFGKGVISFDVVSLEDLNEPREVHTVVATVESIYLKDEVKTFQMVDETDTLIRIKFDMEDLNGPAKYEANITYP